jgi:hypothetical protein
MPRRCTPACLHSKKVRRYTVCKCRICKGQFHGVGHLARMSEIERKRAEIKVMAEIEAERMAVDEHFRAVKIYNSLVDGTYKPARKKA